MQCLTGHLATLGQFIARFTDKRRPFFNTLQGAKVSGWTDECGHAFEAIKRYQLEPPILSSPPIWPNDEMSD